MYEKQEHYLPITIWYLQHVGNHAIMPKNRRPGSRHQSLKDRVAALEKATEGLNTSFASLQALMQKTKSLSELLRLKMA